MPQSAVNNTTSVMAESQQVTKTTQAGMFGIQALAAAAAATQKINVSSPVKLCMNISINKKNF